MNHESLALDYKPRLPRNLGAAIGCIGSGFIMDKCHLTAYRRAGFNPVAIASRSREHAQQVAQQHGIASVYDTYQELLADERIEVVDIAVPPDVQLEVVRQVVRHAGHVRGVLAQKPLATGYAQLFQGTSATGVNPGANPTLGGINNGNLAAIRGANLDPGPSSASFETSKSGPQFLTPHQGLIGTTISTFPARITGKVVIDTRAAQAAAHMGRANAFRGDQGAPITIGSIAHTGQHVTINSPLGGTLTIGQNFRAGTNAVILGGPNVNAVFGDDVKIGSGAVVVQTSLGAHSTVGPGAYLASSTFPANTNLPAKAIYVSNKFQGYVSW